MCFSRRELTEEELKALNEAMEELNKKGEPPTEALKKLMQNLKSTRNGLEVTGRRYEISR